jgi:hypothetical protein
MLSDCRKLLAASDQDNRMAVLCKSRADDSADCARAKNNKTHDALSHGILGREFSISALVVSKFRHGSDNGRRIANLTEMSYRFDSW